MKIFGCGDIFIARRLARKGGYFGYEAVRNLITSHDACFANLETTVHNNEGYPSRFPGGGWAMASPECIRDLKDMGFDIFNLANNHALDYSHKGMEATLCHLKRQGLKYTGAGMNLAEASKPEYVECENGRVAFIGVTSSFHDSDAAGPAGGLIPGRPGVNPLRRKEFYQLTPDLYKAASQIAEATGMNDGHKWSIANGYREQSKDVFLREMQFVEGERNCRVTHPLSVDMNRVNNAIKEAKIQADFVVVTFHSHQMNGSSEIPAEFIVEFCHNCVDNGANAIFGHGAHELQGIELYKGVPIFYGMGDFILHNEFQEALPKEFFEKNAVEPDYNDLVGVAMNIRSKGGTRGLQADPKAWEAIGASIDYENGKVYKVKVYPFALGFEKERSQRGWPCLDDSGKVLKYISSLSKKLYGTQIEIKDNYGEIVFA